MSPLAVAAAREAFAGWSKLPGSERAKYLFRIARILQERSRELAVLESLNGGKPIKESRDVDVPLAAAHFFYYAGWADKLEYAFPNRSAAPARRRRADHPVELPAADAGVEARARARRREHRRAEAGRDDAALGAPFLRRPATGRAAPGRRQHRHGRRPHGRGARRVGGREDRVHRLDRGRQGDPAPACRHGQEAHARARRQGREHRLRRRRARPGGRGDRERDLLQPGPRLLRRLAALRAGVDRGAARSTSSSSGWRRSGSATRSTRTPTSARSTPAPSSRRSRELVASGTAEGAEIYQPPCRLPEKGYWFAPTVFTNVAQSYRIAQEEIFGPVLSVLTFRTPEEALEKANNTPYGLSRGCLDREGLADPLDGRATARRRRLGEHVQPFRPDEPVRRLQGVGLRPRGRAATGSSRTSRSTATVVEVRAATAADEEPLRRLDRAAWTTYSSPGPLPEGESFFDEKTRPADVLVAVVDGEVAGYLRLAKVEPVRLERSRAHDQRRCRRSREAAARGRARPDRSGGCRGPPARCTPPDPSRLLPEHGARALYESAGFEVEGVLRGEFFLGRRLRRRHRDGARSDSSAERR